VKAWFEAQGKGPVDMQPGKAGQFDVSVDGRLAYSRYETGRFPSEADLEKGARPAS
jgi:predicted Rdx family selenoprotein